MVIVFDGCSYSLKEGTEGKRFSKRELNREEGLRLLKHGDRQKGLKKILSAIDVTPEMAFAVKTHLLEVYEGQRKGNRTRNYDTL